MGHGPSFCRKFFEQRLFFSWLSVGWRRLKTCPFELGDWR
jgi:hypothetical protein